MEKDPYKSPEQAQEVHRSNIEDSNVNQNQLNVSVYTGQSQAATEHKLDRQEYRNRRALLDKVKQFWIKGVLERSLYNRAKIELGLEERFDALNIEYAYPETSRQPLPSGITVYEQFFQETSVGRTLLILGDPGAGKTTTLLELTQNLILEAENNSDSPIPVVFNLASWSNPKQTIFEWLVNELNSKYQVNKLISKQWFNRQDLFLMLDGLDEVQSELRKACIEAIDSFHQTYGQTEIVVCCRILDYEKLDKNLKFNNAVFIQPLTSSQISDYLDQAGHALLGVKVAISKDKALRDLAKSPLMLSILALAYQGSTPEKLPGNSDIELTQKVIFETYISKMLSRRRVKSSYNAKDTLRWLKHLAKNLSRESETVFLIENLQATWLHTNYQLWLYTLSISILVGLGCTLLLAPVLDGLSRMVSHTAPLSYLLGAGLSAGAIWGIAFILFGNAVSRSVGQILIGTLGGMFWGIIVFTRGNPATAYIGSGIIYALLLGLSSGIMSPKIQVIERLEWSWQGAKTKLSIGLATGLLTGMLLGGILGFFMATKLTGNLLAILLLIVIFSFLLGLVCQLIGGVVSAFIGGINSSEVVATRVRPNEGIHNSLRYTIWILILGTLLFGIAGLALKLPNIFAISLGGVTSLLSAGSVVLKHSTLRLIMWLYKLAPFKYAIFLSYCVDCILLQRVGGGYIFIHRSLLDYFAHLNKEDFDKLVDQLS